MPLPLVLLDVDGVLNALAGRAAEAWPEYRTGSARADGRAWPISWAPPVTERVAGWQRDGVAEVQWLTTWGHHANDELRRLVGLPELAVAGTYHEFYDDPGAPEPVAADAHAAVAPAAPDPLTGHWWKYDVVQRLLRQHPGRRVAWLDDELHDRTPFAAAAATLGVLAVGPDPRTGLSPAELEEVEAFLRAGG